MSNLHSKNSETLHLWPRKFENNHQPMSCEEEKEMMKVKAWEDHHSWSCGAHSMGFSQGEQVPEAEGEKIETKVENLGFSMVCFEKPMHQPSVFQLKSQIHTYCPL